MVISSHFGVGDVSSIEVVSISSSVGGDLANSGIGDLDFISVSTPVFSGGSLDSGCRVSYAIGASFAVG